MHKSIYIWLLVFLPFVAMAQRQEKSWEIPLFLGAANYVGDLAPEPVIGESHAALGGGVKRNFNQYFSLGLHFTYGTISGSDQNFDYLAQRNLQFESPILELAPIWEFNFFRFGNGFRAKRFSPYVFTGLSFFLFNPKAQYKGDTYSLQPLRTEGQGVVHGAPDPYSLFNLAVPIGGGLKLNLSKKWNIGFQVGYRTTFTDYLDDVGGTYTDKQVLLTEKGDKASALSDRSGETTGEYIGIKGFQRGNPDTKDWYIFAGFNLSYIIPAGRCPSDF